MTAQNKGGRPTNAERDARRVAEALKEFRDSIPQVLVEATRLIKGTDASAAVKVQLAQSLEKLVGLLPSGALTPEPEANTDDREFVRESIRRFCVAGDRPLPDVIAELKAGSDIAVAETERLRVALDQAESLQRRLDEVELRPRAAAAASRGAPVKAQDPPAPTADPPAARWEPGGRMSESGAEYVARVRLRRRGGPDL